MALRNTTEQWGSLAKFFHWTIGLLILAVFVVGVVMEDVADGPDKYFVYAMHKSVGLLVLALVVLRLGWRLMGKVPAPAPGTSPTLRLAGEVAHWGLYALMVGVPLSGWLVHSYAGFPLNWFTVQALPVPSLVAPDRSMVEEVGDLHGALAWAILALVALHIAGALYHHVMRKDNTLRRMLPFVRLK